ncbi:MAG: hypothetical protein Fur0032_16990 [Terrimicrobiaceae bacterium]
MFSALTFNMQNGEPWTGDSGATPPAELDRTIHFLRSHAADVIFLQEVEAGIDGGEQIQPPPNFSRLREALPDYDAVFGYPPVNPDELPFGIGLAIFSRTPLGSFRSQVLPAAPVPFEFGGRSRMPSDRLLIEATTTIAGHRVELMNTHLQAFFMIGSTSDAFPAQRDAVAARLSRVEGAALLAGDFNCTPEESLLEQFRAAGFEPGQESVVTWRRRPYVLDHIFFCPPLRLLECAVIETDVSDHHAVRAEFDFNE